MPTHAHTCTPYLHSPPHLTLPQTPSSPLTVSTKSIPAFSPKFLPNRLTAIGNHHSTIDKVTPSVSSSKPPHQKKSPNTNEIKGNVYAITTLGNKFSNITTLKSDTNNDPTTNNKSRKHGGRTHSTIDINLRASPTKSLAGICLELSM